MIKRRTQLSHAIRGLAAEFGATAPTGLCRIGPLLETIAADETIPALARELFGLHAQEYTALAGEIARVEEKLMVWHHSDECSQGGFNRSSQRFEMEACDGDQEAAFGPVHQVAVAVAGEATGCQST